MNTKCILIDDLIYATSNLFFKLNLLLPKCLQTGLIREPGVTWLRSLTAARRHHQQQQQPLLLSEEVQRRGEALSVQQPANADGRVCPQVREQRRRAAPGSSGSNLETFTFFYIYHL